MTATHYELPANLTAKKLISALSDKFETHVASKQYLLKTYYDSFDWRLYKHDLICEFNRSKQSSSLILSNRKTNDLVASTILFDVPSFCKQFNPGKVRQALEPVLGIRALIAVCTLECEAYHLDITDQDEKVVLRLLIEEFELLSNRLTLFPVKGNAKFIKQITDLLINDLGLTTANKPVLLQALSLQGRLPKDYSAKLDLSFTPHMPADTACKAVFSSLLKIIKLNEQGVIADTDSEFLHDYRIAVRKTRVGLNQMKNILPQDVLTQYKEFFSWLGKITNECRDLDVYLLNFDDYKKKLPSAIRQNINPLQQFLAAKKQKSHKQLARQLRSKKYKTTLTKWEAFLTCTARDSTDEQAATITAKDLADRKIHKTYKNIIKLGEQITPQSPPEALHNLRKICKRLRYLMEFFQNLYPERRISKSIASLKKLQDVLGDYQDYAVQQEQLQQFSGEMQATNTPSKTFLAMGVLIQEFENRKCKARNRFDAQFAAFKKANIKGLL
ncbi:hypothetical protein MCAMS1_01808 [biofilm metagenome]